MKAHALLYLIVLGLCIGLAVFIGQTLSGEAMAAVFGVILGALASIPTALLVMWLAARALPLSQRSPARHVAPPEAPRVIIVTPPGASRAEPRADLPAPSPQQPRGRYTVIGGEE
jgi:hypothetical protein